MPAEFNSFQDPLASLVSHFLFSSFHFPSPLIEHKPALPEWATLVFGPRRFFSVPFLKDDATTGSGAGGVFFVACFRATAQEGGYSGSLLLTGF